MRRYGQSPTGIDDPVQAASFVVGRIPSRSSSSIDRKGELSTSTKPDVASAAAMSPRTLVARQAGRPVPGDDRFDGVKDLSPDLLDIVVGIGEIGPPTRRRDRQPIIMFYDGRTDGPEQFDDAVMIDICAENDAGRVSAIVVLGERWHLPPSRSPAASHRPAPPVTGRPGVRQRTLRPGRRRARNGGMLRTRACAGGRCEQLSSRRSGQPRSARWWSRPKARWRHRP